MYKKALVDSLKNPKTEIIFLILVIILGCLLRLGTNPDWAIETYFGGDAINRLSISLAQRDHGLTLKLHSFWLPLFFIINALPLFISRTVESIISFNLIINLFSVLIFYFLIKRAFNKPIAISSFLLFTLLPEYNRLAMAVMSENLYSFFVIGGLASFYRYRDKRHHNYFLLSLLCFGSAMLIRYEGLILFISFLIYTSVFEKKFKWNVLIGIIFFILLGIYEYQRYLDTGVPLHGLVANGAEVQKTILVRGNVQELVPRFQKIRVFFQEQGGTSVILPLLGVLTFLRFKSPLNPYIFTFLVSFVPLLLGSVKGDILLFPRYWALPIALSIPLSLLLIQDFFRKFNNDFLQKMAVPLITIISFFTFVFEADKWAPPAPSKIREMTQYLVSKNYYKNKKVFHDDLNFSWSYDAIYVYLRIDHELNVDCCNVDSSSYIENGYVLNESNREIYKSLINNERPNVFVLGNNSPMSKFIKENNFELSYGKLEKIKEFGDYRIYEVKPSEVSE